jgi:atypical dual specificity phosphatase
MAALRNFSFVIDGELAGSAHPVLSVSGPEQFKNVLAEYGLGAVVSLDERGLPAHWPALMGAEYLHIRIPDFEPPSAGQIDEFIALVEKTSAAGRATLAHCYAGMGRTGTMIACYLVKKENLPPDEAIHRVRRMRPGSIETYGQEDSVRAYQRRLKAGTKGPEE